MILTAETLPIWLWLKCDYEITNTTLERQTRAILRGHGDLREWLVKESMAMTWRDKDRLFKSMESIKNRARDFEKHIRRDVLGDNNEDVSVVFDREAQLAMENLETFIEMGKEASALLRGDDDDVAHVDFAYRIVTQQLAAGGRDFFEMQQNLYWLIRYLGMDTRSWWQRKKIGRAWERLKFILK